MQCYLVSTTIIRYVLLDIQVLLTISSMRARRGQTRERKVRVNPLEHVGAHYRVKSPHHRKAEIGERCSEVDKSFELLCRTNLGDPDGVECSPFVCTGGVIDRTHQVRYMSGPISQAWTQARPRVVVLNGDHIGTL